MPWFELEILPGKTLAHDFVTFIYFLKLLGTDFVTFLKIVLF